MQTISESSFSEQFTNGVSIPQSKLDRLEMMEIGIYQRITQLRNHKIKLMSTLSLCIDKKNYAQNQLFKVLQQRKTKQQKMANESQCKKVIMKHFQLKQQQDELKRKIGDASAYTQQQDDILLQIIKQRAQNKVLQDKLSDKGQVLPTVQHQVIQLKRKIQALHQRVSVQQQQVIQSTEKDDVKLNQLLAYVEDQQNHKRMLYQQVADFIKQMEELRAQNQMLLSRQS